MIKLYETIDTISAMRHLYADAGHSPFNIWGGHFVAKQGKKFIECYWYKNINHKKLPTNSLFVCPAGEKYDYKTLQKKRVVKK